MFNVCLTLKGQWWNILPSDKVVEIFTDKLMKRVTSGQTEI